MVAQIASLGTVAFIGMGLIGGSLARALREAKAADNIIAFDVSKAALAEALALGVIDRAVDDISAVTEADVIVLATPVHALFDVCTALATLPLKNDVVISDVGSTKGSVLEAMRNAFGEVPPYFVPAHPIAGRERSGVTASETDLFRRHKVILTTLPNTDNRALGIISRMWHSAGAVISYMSIAEHDEILGATSHLPHILAYLLVDMLNQDLHHDEIFNYAAGGFRDFTRIASSNPIMWRDICVHNADVLRDLLSQYRHRIEQFEQLLSNKDGQAVEMIFRRAKTARDKHYQKEQNQ